MVPSRTVAEGRYELGADPGLLYVTGMVDQELLARNEYLAAEIACGQKTEMVESTVSYPPPV
jgi:hypothetical protein